MNSLSDYLAGKLATAALLAFVGICAVASGVAEGVWLIAAGAIVAILVRAIHVSNRDG